MLTDAERMVMYLLSTGKSSKQVASQLNISIRTVSEHTKNAKEALQADTLYQAVAIYATQSKYIAKTIRKKILA